MSGPILRVLARNKCRRELLSRGYSRHDVRDALDDLDDDAVDQTYAMYAGVGAIGDGKIIDAILEWLKSDQGKAFIEALMKILLAFLGG